MHLTRIHILPNTSKEEKNKGKDKGEKGNGSGKDLRCQICGGSLVSSNLGERGKGLNCKGCGVFGYDMAK